MGKSKRKRSRSRSDSRSSDISNREMKKRIKRLETRLEKAIKYGYRNQDDRSRDRSHNRSQDRSPRGSTYDSRSLKSSSSRHNRGTSCSSSFRSSPARELNSSSRDCSVSPDRSLRGSTGAFISDDQTLRVLTPDNTENIPPENDILIISNNETLDEDVLRHLGEDPLAKNDKVFELHKAVSTRWENILNVGLDNKIKQELMEKYPSPSNLKELKAPILNQEVLPVISNYTLKKDKYQIFDQNQLSAGITAIGAGINILLENTEASDKAKLLPLLSDAGRLLVDLHHNMSIRRRAFITPALNKAAKDIIDTSPVDNFLFGSDFGDRCKAIKVVERSSNDIKSLNLNKNTVFKKPKAPGVSYKQNKPLNWKGPSRYQGGEARKKGIPSQGKYQGSQKKYYNHH